MKSKPYKLLYWLPRILAIIAILFVSMFALDTFESGLSPWKQLMAYMMRLIPSYLLVALLILAWHREVVGGVLFIVVGLAFTPAVFMHVITSYSIHYTKLYDPNLYIPTGSSDNCA